MLVKQDKMLLTLLSLVDMFGVKPSPKSDAAPYIQNKEDEGGGHKGKEDEEKIERRIEQDNEDITIILSNWIFNQN